MFADWENFYLIVGSAAGALIGVMFLVATLTAGIDTGARMAQSRRVYITPIVFHLSVIVVVSAIAAVPKISEPAAGVLLAFTAAIGLAYTATATIRMFWGGLTTQPDMSDKWFYEIFPTILYVGFAAAVATIWLRPEDAAYVLGAVMLALLLVGIRNAWDLATFIVERSSDQRNQKDTGTT